MRYHCVLTTPARERTYGSKSPIASAIGRVFKRGRALFCSSFRPLPRLARASGLDRARRRGVHHMASVLFVLGVFTLSCQPLQHMVASAIVVAPNRGAPPPATIDGEFSVLVGPPSATLSLEIIDGKDPFGTVFVLHGIRDDKRSVRRWGQMLAAAGMRAVLVDLRGHGRSTGDWLSYGIVESRDLMQALDAIEERGLRVGLVGVMGISYGAAVAIEWAGSDARIRAVVAIAPFASLRSVVPAYAPVPLPASFVSGAIDMAGREGGFDPDEASPVLAIARSRAAVLLIHGLDDHRIPAWHSKLILAAGRGHTELFLVPGAGHRSIASDPVIRDRAPAWLAQHLQRSGSADGPRDARASSLQ
jgi:pimeloyl-ACP methyl ester carboxylesterase